MKLPINRILLIILLIIAVIITTAIYLMVFHENPPVEFYNLPFPTDRTEYSAGDEIWITVDLCKYTEAPFTAYISFIDGLIFSTPQVSFEGTPVGCGEFLTNAIKVPDNLPPGTYYLSAKNEYQVNFLAIRQVDWYSQEFTILP